MNPTEEHRQKWKETFEQHGIQTIFIESLCDDQEIIEQNVRSVKISSPDVPSLSIPLERTSSRIPHPRNHLFISSNQFLILLYLLNLVLPFSFASTFLSFSSPTNPLLPTIIVVRRLEPRRRSKRLHSPHQRQNPQLPTPHRNRHHLHQTHQREPTHGSAQRNRLLSLSYRVLSHESAYPETHDLLCESGEKYECDL